MPTVTYVLTMYMQYTGIYNHVCSSIVEIRGYMYTSKY